MRMIYSGSKRLIPLYDNSENDGAYRIARKHRGELRIFPNEYWSVDQIYQLLGIE